MPVLIYTPHHPASNHEGFQEIEIEIKADREIGEGGRGEREREKGRERILNPLGLAGPPNYLK